MKYFINFYLEGNKVQKPSDGVSSGKWRLVDEETITPQYSLPEVRITGEHPIWSLPGYKGKQDKYRNLTKRDKDLIWRNTLEHNKRGVQYMKWAAPLAASPVFFMTGAAGATGNALLNLGRSIITHPLRTAAEFVGADIAGNTVDKTVLRTTGDKNFGAMVGRVTNTPELNGLWQFGNPGYLVGGFVGDMTHRLATTGVKRVSPIINEHVSSIISRNQPMLLPAYVGGVPGTMRAPWTLYEPAATAPRTLNFLGLEIRDGGLHRKEGWWGKKPAESAPAAEATPRSSFNGYYDESGNPVTLYERTDPKATYYRRDESFGTAYEKVPQTQEIYDEASNPVDINTAVPGTKYIYSDMTPATVFREVQTPVPTQLYYRIGESSPRGGFFDIYEPSPSNTEGLVTAKGTPATNIYRKVNPQTANRYKSYEGSDGTMYGQDLYDLYDSPLKSNRRRITPTNEELVPWDNPSLRQAYRASKNPSNTGNRKVLHQRAGNGNNGTVVSDPIDPSFLEDIRSKGAWLPGNRKFNLTGLGILGGTGLGRWGIQNILGFSQWRPDKKEENPQQTNDTTPENTPTNTPQTSDTTGRAERMAQRRKELGITE